MNKSLYLATTLFLSAVATGSALAADVESLRGARGIDETAAVPEMKQYRKDGDVLPRDYVQQPPLIPHKIEGYRITLKYNKCLTCHSWAKYKEAGATEISQTHFEDRDKHVLANISARRYFCTQCHVPQANARPLVENTFEPVPAIAGE